MAKKATRVRQQTLVQRGRRMAPQDKALLHEETGRVRRPFLGLLDTEVDALAKRIGDHIVVTWEKR
jgi:hypothetical protein